jgi:NAD+ synthase (glutamine-hydrolysing)
MKYFEEDYYLAELDLCGKKTSKQQEDSNTKILAEQKLSESKDSTNPSTTTLSEVSALVSPPLGAASRKYFYAASEVGRDADTLKYLTEEKNIQEIHDALVLGIRDYFNKMGFQKSNTWCQRWY